MQPSDNSNRLLQMVQDVLRMGLRAKSYYNRAMILKDLHPAICQPDGSFLINAETVISSLAQKLFASEPSFKEQLKCDKCLNVITENRTVPSVELNECKQANIDILKILYLPGQRICSFCAGIMKRQLISIGIKFTCILCYNQSLNITYLTILGTFAMFEIVGSDNYIRLNQIAKKFKNPLNEEFYYLVGAVHYHKPAISNIGHYVAYCLRGGIQWIQYDDVKKKEHAQKDKHIININLLIYAK